MVMDQLILLHKPNKKVRSEKKMDHFIPQTKHTLIFTTVDFCFNKIVKILVQYRYVARNTNHFDGILQQFYDSRV
jgi:hypothetical protein